MNCRDDNMCVFCKHWIGGEPNVNYLTGDCRDRIKDGLCAKDSSEKNIEQKVCVICFQGHYVICDGRQSCKV